MPIRNVLRKVVHHLAPAWDSKRQAGQSRRVFDQGFYSDITEARLKHLDSLGFNVDGRSVIDVGCGIGRLSEYFAARGCNLLCVDGREENILELKRLYPDRRAVILDLDSQPLTGLGRFDVVFCYGLLYHLADPFHLIKQAYAICDGMFLLETCITDADDPLLSLVAESVEDASQALHAIGCRPSPAYVRLCLRLAGFAHVYTPRSLPLHAQFQYERRNDHTYLRNGTLMRGVFIASNQPIDNANLVPG